MQGNAPDAGKAPRLDVYERVTSRIVADLESGTRPWLKPWSVAQADRPALLPLRANGTPYRGINILLLWGAALDVAALRAGAGHLLPRQRLDDLQAGGRAGRPGAQGRAQRAGRLRRPLHEDRDRRRGRGR